jgi:hypothetical protein
MTFPKYLAALLLVALGAAVTEGGPPRRYRWSRAYWPTQYQSPSVIDTTYSPYPFSPAVYPVSEYPVSSYPAPTYPTSTATAAYYPSTENSTPAVASGEDALAEVNATRAQRGLPPFLPDPLLNQAAQACAKQRAARLVDGHLPESDFAYLPAGTSASAAGCAAWTPDWGWGSCCTYDHYTYAGAAWSMGQDGRRYMHLFVR